MTTAEKVIAALESHGLKKEGANKYRCNSPFRPGSDSKSFTLTIDDGEHGDDGKNADSNAQQRERGSEQVCPKRLPGETQAFHDLTNNFHRKQELETGW